MKEIIKKNQIRCKSCKTVISSTYRHDFKWCKCGKVAVDGGTDYLKRVGELEDIEELSVVEKKADDLDNVVFLTRHKLTNKEHKFLFVPENRKIMYLENKDVFSFWDFADNFEEAVKTIQNANLEIVEYSEYAPKSSILTKTAKEEGFLIHDVKIPKTQEVIDDINYKLKGRSDKMIALGRVLGVFEMSVDLFNRGALDMKISEIYKTTCEEIFHIFEKKS